MEAMKIANFSKKQLRSGSTAIIGKKNSVFDTLKTSVFSIFLSYKNVIK